MYITKKFLSRRTLLKGAGVSIALPFLDSMVPAFASTPDIPLRFGVTYSPNGIIREAWEVPEGQTATRDMIYSQVLITVNQKALVGMWVVHQCILLVWNQKSLYQKFIAAYLLTK